MIGPLAPVYLPELIQSERIVLKRHTIDLASVMFSRIERDRARLRVFLPWVDGLRSVEDECDYVRMTRESWDQHQLFEFGIFGLQGDLQGVYLGNVGVHSISWQHRRCELGYWILGEFEGKGYVSEAVRALDKILFSSGFHRVEIHCSTNNLRSASVPLHCGYRSEGTQRDDRIEEGAYTDTLIFGKLESDVSM